MAVTERRINPVNSPCHPVTLSPCPLDSPRLRVPVSPRHSAPSSALGATREGLYWLLGVVILLAQGWLRNFNLVTLTATMMLSMWLFNLAWIVIRFRRNMLIVTRKVEGPVFAGQPFSVVLEAENHSGRPSGGVRIGDRGLQHCCTWF